MKNEKVILHIAPDEKFIKSANWQFEKMFPGKNHFIIYLEDHSEDLKFVEKADNIEIIKVGQINFNEFIERLRTYHLVVLHGLKQFQSKVVLKSDNTIPFLWLFWGGEIYDNPAAFKKSLIGEETRKRFEKKSLIDILKQKIRPFYYKFIKNDFAPEILILKAAKSIKNIGILHKEDFDFLKIHKFIQQHSRHIKMTYYPLEFIFKNDKNLSIKGDHILLGNSASTTNNHLEIFQSLKHLDLKNKKLIVPLNYGDKAYATEIVKIGERYFGKNFEPLLNFMPLQEYNNLVQQCSCVIMNHYRQQAVGNILAMLWMGSKVFLSEKNTFYHYLKRIGVCVFSITEDLNNDDSFTFTSLSKNEIDHNRQILENEIGIKIIEKELKKQINQIMI